MAGCNQGTDERSKSIVKTRFDYALQGRRRQRQFTLSK